jgi:hypothetical protein
MATAAAFAAAVLPAARADAPAPPAMTLPPVPQNLPAWMDNRDANHVFWTRGKYNFDVYNLGTLARDLNAVAVGHAMAYEDLVTGKAGRLEGDTYNRIVRVLKDPPRLMPAERSISPTFSRRFGLVEQVFDWAHLLHAQTVDVLASTQLTPEQKDREVERLYRVYRTTVPYAITPLPLNMAHLYGQPYSRGFRDRHPKVNGLFWGYHWLQGAMYDALYQHTLAQQKAAYAVVGEQYRATELYRTNRPIMPMTAEMSPRFAARFPDIANTFDNLHMLHDMVNDILVAPGLTEKQRDEQVRRAVWLVMDAAHKGEKPGDAPEPGGLHDHRHYDGMPGMGLMPGSQKPDLMYMWAGGMGWMSMSECHHCSMPLPGAAAGAEPGGHGASTVTADGWTMRVRCALCARDMSAETKGRAVLHLATEDPARPVVAVSDEQGNLTTDTPGAVFIEQEASHATCHAWSQAFTSRAAFDAYVASRPELAGAKPLTFAEWAQREGKKPDTYYKPQGPVENPFAKGVKE